MPGSRRQNGALNRPRNTYRRDNVRGALALVKATLGAVVFVTDIMNVARIKQEMYRGRKAAV